MQMLRNWSFAKVVLVSGAWILLCVLVVVGWILFQLRGMSSAGSGGIGAVSGGLGLMIPFGPPLVLIVAWIISRL